MLSSSGHRTLISLLVVTALVLSVASAEVILMTSPGCVKCAAAGKVIEKVLAEHGGQELVVHDIYSEEGQQAIRDYNLKGGVPAMVIEGTVIGHKDYDGDLDLLETMIGVALVSGEGHSDVQEGVLDLGSLSMTTVFLAGLLAGFNPCLLGILAFLSTAVISSTGRRRDLLAMVVCFAFGIFAMYYLFGVGMLHTLRAEAIEESFRLGLVLILLVLGAVHVEDARRLSNGSKSLFRAGWADRYIEKLITRGRYVSYFLLGALFSLVKAPCVGAVYIAILGLISDQGYSDGAVYLLLYNLGVILPVILLGGFITLGMSPAKVDEFRKNHRAGIRLATGLTLLALAPLIYWQII